jgi:hypothetical protein
MLVDVIAAHVVSGHLVFLRFEDGLEGEVDFAPLIPARGVFALLQDPSRFAELRVDPDLGTVCWPNGADIAPETLYNLLRPA